VFLCSLVGFSHRAMFGSPVLVAAAPAPMPAACGGDGAKCLRELTMSGGWKVAAYSNVAITDNAAVTHAMLVIHGGGRDAAATFAGMTQAATQAGVAANTLVVAPWFKTAQDRPGPNEAIWTDNGWKVGDSAVTPPGLSSFTVADEILAASVVRASGGREHHGPVARGAQPPSSRAGGRQLPQEKPPGESGNVERPNSTTGAAG
jgi:hypothetical protein